MSKATAQITAVATPDIGGVKIRRHILDSEVKRLAWIARRLGVRLRGQLIALDENALPSEEWLEHAKWYQGTVLGLLKEQRERARIAMGAGLEQLTDEEYKAELDAMGQQAVENMSADELRKVLAEKEKAK